MRVKSAFISIVQAHGGAPGPSASTPVLLGRGDGLSFIPVHPQVISVLQLALPVQHVAIHPPSRGAEVRPSATRRRQGRAEVFLATPAAWVNRRGVLYAPS